jgi:hypothetical protein
MRSFPAIGGLLVSIGVGSIALGAEPKLVPGLWFSFVDSAPFRLGLVMEARDAHPYFFDVVCGTWPAGPGKVKPVANITMQPEHQVVSQAIVSNSYLVARLEGDGESYELWAKSINVNEGPSFSFWVPEFESLQPEKLVPILLSDKVLLHFGLRTGDGKVSLLETYRLPDENRITAVDFFANACFPDWSKGVR